MPGLKKDRDDPALHVLQKQDSVGRDFAVYGGTSQYLKLEARRPGGFHRRSFNRNLSLGELRGVLRRSNGPQLPRLVLRSDAWAWPPNASRLTGGEPNTT